MSKQDDDGVIVEIDPRQLNLTLDPETERKAEPKKEAGRKDDVEPETEAKGGGEDAIEALQRQLDALKAENDRERTARVAKEREAAEARAQAQQTYGYAQQKDYDLVNTNINNAKARAEAIKREMKIARESGNTDLESDLMIENARLGASLEREETRKREIEDKYRREQAQREREVARPADPIEAAIQNVSPKSQAWLRAHPECITDDVMNARVLLADKEARRKGFAADTPDYFQYIEEQMGYRKPARSEADTSDEPETRRTEEKSERRGSYAAPVSRDASPSSGGLKPSQRRLTREQVETAEALGMTPAAYATWLAKAEKDGKYANH